MQGLTPKGKQEEVLALPATGHIVVLVQQEVERPPLLYCAQNTSPICLLQEKCCLSLLMAL